MTDRVLTDSEAFSDPVRIALFTIDTFVRTGRIPECGEVPASVAGCAGCFVSIHSHGNLRGCIGTIGPTEDSLTEEIIRNAVSACTADPRFYPVRPDELESLEISVDILGNAEPVNSRADLDPSVYGVIVTNGLRRGLLLPDLEGVDDAETQLAIACRKACIGPDEPYSIQRFKVTRYH